MKQQKTAKPFSWHTTTVGDVGWTNVAHPAEECERWAKGTVTNCGRKLLTLKLDMNERFVKRAYSDVFTEPKVEANGNAE